MSKAGKIVNFDSNPSIFAGQGDLIMFDAISDYSDATLASLENPKSLGQIVQDSTSWDGDDVEVSQIKDEQGNLITARTTAGTLAFSFELASTSKSMVEQFLKGQSITITSSSGLDGFVGDPANVVGFGHELPVFTRPIAILNDEKTRLWLYPKSKITSNLSYSDGLWRIKASVLAENVNTANMKTGMIIDAVAKYTTDSTL